MISGQQLLVILLTGWAVLIAAIMFNIIAGLLHLTGWYTYLGDIRSSGFIIATKSAGIISCLFMYLIYPAGLGFTAIWIYEKLKLLMG